MADLATLQSRLTEAEDAYHRLMTGAMEVQVGQGDFRAQYTSANAGQLRAYIDDLRTQIAAAGGSAAALRRRGIEVNL